MLRVISPALRVLLRPSLRRFKRELRDPRRAQARLLKKLIARLSKTEYGRALRVRTDDDYEAFAARVPVVDYDDVKEWIERQKSEEKNILVAEPVLFYEKTSGSAGAAKLIPYTASLKASFNRMFLLHLGDLLERGPRMETGKTFISVSPAAEGETTARGKRIGLEDDTDYLSVWPKRLLEPFLAVPSSIKKIRDATSFRRALVAMLIAADDLEIISVWNPTLLEILMDFVEERRARIIEDLKRGRLDCENLRFEFRRVSDARLKLLKEQPTRWAEIWPRLKLISCWASANAAPSAKRIKDRFPNALVQGKGLLATEAPMTVPLIEARGFAPLPSEVFYEFEDERGEVSLIDEIEEGRDYRLVITQKGGLYRYRIGDRVRATHFYQSAPCLEFQGRADAVSDIVGEKLNEKFVEGCLARIDQGGRFQTLLPVIPEKGAAHYLLIVDALNGSIESCEERLEAALCEAYHYRVARRLGQLERARARVVRDATEIYFDYFTARGMKLGDIKHQYLIKNLEDAAALLKRFRG
ncbi:MAG: GH3 auxin-responsive promoter family protein [Acidobacteriota bacterium]